MPTAKKLNIIGVMVVSRPFWWLNTAVPFLVGILLTSQAFNLAAAVGFLYFLVPYNLLMYGVNDIFDYESDIKNPRKNGSINGSVLPKNMHKKLWLVMVSSNIPFVLYFLYIGNSASNIFLCLIIFMVFAYSQKGLRFKETPGLDSLTSAFHYSSPFIFGILLAGGTDLWLPVFSAFFLWVAANHIFGAIRDIIPDKQAGISSVATRLGAEKSLILTLSLYIAAGLVPVMFYGVTGLVGTLAVLPYLLIILRCLPQRNNAQAKVFSTSWNYFLACNYIIGGLGSLILLYLYNN